MPQSTANSVESSDQLHESLKQLFKVDVFELKF